MQSELGTEARATTAIYTLSDPRDGRVRYIGKTERSLKQRLSQHVYASEQSSHFTANWIKSLLAEGLIPIIEELEVIEVGGDWVEAEQRWIKIYRERGAALTNLGDGGEGNPGFTHRQETRLRLSQATAAHMNKPDVKRKHAFGMSDFEHGDIESILRRVANGETQMSIATDYGVTQNYVSRIVTGASFGWMHELEELRKDAQAATYSNSHKLDVQQVCQIVEDYIAAGGRKSFESIAKGYGVTYSTVHEIISGQIWRGVVPKVRLLMAQDIARNCARQKPSARRKLTYQQAEDIRAKHENGVSVRALSRQHHVDRLTVKKIITRQTYRESGNGSK